MRDPFPSRCATALRRAILFGAVLYYAQALPALDPERRISQYVHDSWTTNHGLPQDSINQIAQTPDGYLWVATQEGLARFDGVSFTTFDSRNTPSLEGDFIHTLFVDRAGTLWAGASGGLLRYDGDGRFVPVGVAQGFPGTAARYISQDAAGNLWVSFGTGRPTGGKGLVRYKDGKVRTFTRAGDGLSGNQVYQTWPARGGDLWIATGRGLSVMRNGAFTHYTTAQGLPDDFVRVVIEDRAGNIWAGTQHGLARFDGTKFTTFTTADGLLSNEIEALFEDSDGVLWIATDTGVNRFVNGRFEWAAVEGLRDDRIFAFFEDREGNLWVGTHASGLHRLRTGKFAPWGPPEGLLGQSVQGILQDAQGRIWMGTAPGGVNVLDGDRITSYSRRDGLPTNNARAFFQDRGGAMWIGTTDGLARFENDRFTFYDIARGLPHLSVNVVYEDRAGTLWVGTNGGLARRIGERFEPAPLENAADLEVRVIHEDIGGRLLIAGGDGAGFVEQGRFVPLLPGTLARANVMSVHEDPDGTLWLTTWGDGLFRVRNGRSTHYTARNGLFDDTVWSIVDDGRGDFWMGSNRGVFRVSRRQLDDFAAGRTRALTCVVYDTSNGMRRRETNFGKPAALRARDGRLWFGTTGGAVVVDPARLRVNRLPPNVVIEHFVVNDQEIAAREPLVLRPGSRNIEVHYAALSFVAPAKVRYRYLLEGYDDTWHDVGPRRSAYFTNVTPGQYTFRVVAANEDGFWSPTGVALTFRIRPFFHQTWWFYALIALALVLLGFLLHYVRKRQSEIRYRVYHDPLTGLPNRALLSERAEVALRQAIRRGRSIAILFLDLDGFKGVNDQFGHAAGDELLRLVSDRLRACIREVDTLARIGGDEFAVLVADLEHETRAAEVAQRMIDAVRRGFILAGQPIPLGVSIGIAFHPYDGTDIATILQAADRAMYRAKLSGGNAYQYNSADRDEVVRV